MDLDLTSAEGLEALGMLGAMAWGRAVVCGTLLDNHEALAADLGRVDPVGAAASLASLLTVPEIRANTTRLEALIALALVHGNGRERLSPKLAAEIFNALGEGVAGRLEDPAEDVMVAAVQSPWGNFRILEGIWEGSSFYLQRFIDVLAQLPSEPAFARLRSSCLALMRLSEEVCARAGLERWTLGEEMPVDELPTAALAGPLSKTGRVRFTRTDLKRLGVREADLEPFLFDLSRRKDLADQALGDSALERAPVIKRNNTYTFALPTAVSPAIRYLVAAELERLDQMAGLTEALGQSYAIVLDSDANGDITTACIFNRSQTYVNTASTCSGAQLKTSYGYTAISSRYYLTSATDVDNQTTTYTNVYGGVTCIKPPGFASCKMTMTADQVSTQTLADGGTWTVYRSDTTELNNPDEAAPGEGHNEIEILDPSGASTYLTFTKTSPYSMTDANGRVTQFRYEGGVPIYDPWAGVSAYGAMLREATFPEGDKYLAEYNGPFRAVTKETRTAKPGSGLANLVKTYGYGSCTSPGSYKSCGQPITITDPSGNVTNYTYDAAHGGMLTEMKPAPSAGGARPLVVKTYVQKYAYIKNASGSLVPAAAPIWVPSTVTECQTVAGSSTPVCDGAAPSRVTTNQYGADGTANNLLVRGVAVTADGVTRRSCFSYDALGRKISETAPNANLSVCS